MTTAPGGAVEDGCVIAGGGWGSDWREDSTRLRNQSWDDWSGKARLGRVMATVLERSRRRKSVSDSYSWAKADQECWRSLPGRTRRRASSVISTVTGSGWGLRLARVQTKIAIQTTMKP